MISDKMKQLVNNNSVIREMFEEGKKLAKIYGSENVFDFSLGNPSVEPPKIINETIKKIVDTENSTKLHGYMSNNGFEDVRDKIVKSINEKNNTDFNAENLIMTVGAASGLNIILKSIINPGDEVIVFSPYFVEYKNYINNYDGKIVEVMCDKNTFLPDLNIFEKAINKNTKAVIINTPNNPTGVVYSEDIIQNISKILNKKQEEFNIEIYLISDEPYREIVYIDKSLPYLTKYYNNTFIVYSYSKALSLPGERIGYVLIPDEMSDFENVVSAVTIANRVIGSVNAPSLMQKVVAECANETCNISIYKKNRDLLYNYLTKECGFECIKPEGAFYLFMKTPIENDKEFCSIAKKYNILVVPGSSFSCPGYVRISYCVDISVIEKSLLAFKKLSEELIQKQFL